MQIPGEPAEMNSLDYYSTRGVVTKDADPSTLAVESVQAVWAVVSSTMEVFSRI